MSSSTLTAQLCVVPLSVFSSENRVGLSALLAVKARDYLYQGSGTNKAPSQVGYYKPAREASYHHGRTRLEFLPPSFKPLALALSPDSSLEEPLPGIGCSGEKSFQRYVSFRVGVELPGGNLSLGNRIGTSWISKKEIFLVTKPFF